MGKERTKGLSTCFRKRNDRKRTFQDSQFSFMLNFLLFKTKTNRNFQPLRPRQALRDASLCIIFKCKSCVKRNDCVLVTKENKTSILSLSTPSRDYENGSLKCNFFAYKTTWNVQHWIDCTPHWAKLLELILSFFRRCTLRHRGKLFLVKNSFHALFSRCSAKRLELDDENKTRIAEMHSN